MTARDIPGLLDRLKIDEGFSAKAYRCTAGRLTIGYGHNLDAKPVYGADGKVITTITEPKAAVLLVEDAQIAIDCAMRLVPTFRQLSPARQIVMVSMAFQLGESTFRQFRGTLGCVARQQWRQAAAGMRQSRWAQQTPKRVERLAKMMETG